MEKRELKQWVRDDCKEQDSEPVEIKETELNEEKEEQDNE